MILVLTNLGTISEYVVHKIQGFAGPGVQLHNSGTAVYYNLVQPVLACMMPWLSLLVVSLV